MNHTTRDAGRSHHVVAGVLVQGDAVLLGLRAASKRWYPGVWDLPGGHVEAGETSHGALVRELHEELGIAATVALEAVDRIETDDRRLDVHVVTAWVGEVTNAAPDEHETVRFVTARELESLDLAHPDYRDVLTRLIGATSPL